MSPGQSVPHSLIDLPPSPSQRRAALAFACLLGAIMLTSWMFVGWPAPAIHGPAFFTAYDILSTCLAWVTSFLLISQFRETHRLGLLSLAISFIAIGGAAIVHLLSIPGLLVHPNLFGTDDNTTLWSRVFWLTGVPLGALAYVGFERVQPVHDPHRATVLGVVAALVLIGLVFIVTTRAVIVLPDLTPKPQNFAATYFLVVPTIIAVQIAALTALWWATRLRSVLALWLFLAVFAGLTETVIGWLQVGVLPDRRYSMNFYIARFAGMAANSLLLMGLLNQVAVLYERLARSHRDLEQRVLERTADLQKIVRERDILLREVYHRVKNNLQILDSLIRMQIRRSEQTRPVSLRKLQNQVHTLGLVHSQLMLSDDLKTISFQHFLCELIANLSASLSLEERGIKTAVHADAVQVNMDFAVPLGLVVTELVTNAATHAFSYGRGGVIAVDFRKSADRRALLSIKDNGNDPDAVRRLLCESGVGSKVVKGLAKQLNAKLTASYENGTNIALELPIPEKAA